MRINIDAKILVNQLSLIQEYINELQAAEFKILPNEWGDLNVVKFEGVKVELKFTDQILDKRRGKERGVISIHNQIKKKLISNDVIISNQNVYFPGNELKSIELSKIIQIDVHDTHIEVITAKQRFEISTNSFKFNIHFITMLEWIMEAQIDAQYIGKTIKFAQTK